MRGHFPLKNQKIRAKCDTIHRDKEKPYSEIVTADNSVTWKKEKEYHKDGFELIFSGKLK